MYNRYFEIDVNSERSEQSLVTVVFCYKNCSDLLWERIVDLKKFANSRLSALNFKSFSQSPEHFFLTIGQNNFLIRVSDFIRTSNTNSCFDVAYDLSSWLILLIKSDINCSFFVSSTDCEFQILYLFYTLCGASKSGFSPPGRRKTR